MKYAVYLLLGVICLSGLPAVSDITVPQKDITADCRVEPEPELGKEFTVTITFTINEETYYMDHPKAGALARIGMFPKQEYLGGDTAIFDKIQAGQEMQLSATYRAVNPGKLGIGFRLYTYGEVDINNRPMNNTITPKAYKSYFLPSPDSLPKTLVLDSAGKVIITVVAGDSDSTMPKPKVPYEIVLPENSPSIQSINDSINK